MICQHVPYGTAHNNYGTLARYITDAEYEGGKCLASWCAGCAADDDYELAIVKAQAAQALKTLQAFLRMEQIIAEDSSEGAELEEAKR